VRRTEYGEVFHKFFPVRNQKGEPAPIYQSRFRDWRSIPVNDRQTKNHGVDDRDHHGENKVSALFRLAIPLKWITKSFRAITVRTARMNVNIFISSSSIGYGPARTELNAAFYMRL